MQKLSEIEEKLNKDYVTFKNRYVRLKRCKYFLLILETILLSSSIGRSFLNPLMIIVSSTVPIIDSIMIITKTDEEVSNLKLQKDVVNQIITEIEIKNMLSKMTKKLKIILYKSMEKYKRF